MLIQKKDIEKRLTKRINYNNKLLRKFKKIQLPINYKKKKAKFIIKNDFKKKTVNIAIRKILNKII